MATLNRSAPQPRPVLKVSDCAPPYKIVQARHGWFLVTHEDVYVGRSLLTYGEYAEGEWELIAQLLARKRDAVEVGANIGALTVPMAQVLAKRNRRLWAIEAQPMIHRQLCANLALNAVMNVQAENLACSDAAGWLSFDAPACTQEFNFGAVSMRDDGVGKQRVHAVRLDDLLPPDADIGLLKIDVEGFEQRVLEGAKAMIARCRPFIYLENDRVERSPELIEWLWAASYDLVWHIPMMFNDANFAGETKDIYPNVGSFNMLCVPRESPIATPGMARVEDVSKHPLKR